MRMIKLATIKMSAIYISQDDHFKQGKSEWRIRAFCGIWLSVTTCNIVAFVFGANSDHLRDKNVPNTNQIVLMLVLHIKIRM
jgi:hypothetical protein